MDILNSIPVLSEETPVAPVSLKDIQALHSSLTLENPLTFQIFLVKRPDIVGDERNIYLLIIERLKANEKFRYETAIASMVNADLKPTTDVYDA
jgi:hypothetical protein